MKDFKIGLLVTASKSIAQLTSDFKQKAEDKVKSFIIRNITKYGKIIYPGLIIDTNDAIRAEQEFLINDVDIVLIVEIAYTTSDVPFIATQNIDKPKVILNTSSRRTIDSNFSMLDLGIEQNVLGSVEFASTLDRTSSKHFYTVSGLIDNDNTYEKVGQYLTAAKLVKKLKNSNIGFIGNTVYPGMMDIVVDEVSVKDKFGINVINLDIKEITDIFSKIKIDDIEEEKEKIINNYNNITVNKNDEYFNKSLKMAVCYKKIIRKYNLISVANYCQSTIYDCQIGVPPCMAGSICTSEGVPFSCEGDVGSAIGLFIMKELAGDSSFVEFWMSDYDRNALLIGHCGMGNLNFATDKKTVILHPHPYFVKTEFNGTSFEFSYKEGISTLLNISMKKSCEWRMVICSGEIVSYNKIGIGIPYAWWKTNMDIDVFVERLCGTGASHHMSLAYGKLKEILIKIGSMLNLKIYEVD